MESPKVVRMSNNQELSVLQDAQTHIMEYTQKMREAYAQGDTAAFKTAEAEVQRLLVLYGIANE